MAHYDTDVHCWKCKRYIYSYMSDDPDAEIMPWCEDCEEKYPEEFKTAKKKWDFELHGKRTAEAI